MKCEISEKGRERLAIYNHLFNNPMIEHLTTEAGQKKLNVLIVGKLGKDSIIENTAAYNEIFKAVFSCGQYPGSELSITIVSSDSIELEEKFYNGTESNSDLFRDLRKFIKDKKYANINYISSSIFEDQTILPSYGYIIIHTGDTDHDQTLKENIKAIAPESAIWIYADFCYIDRFEETELFRIASNIDFSYAMEYEENKNKEESNQEFIKVFHEDFSGEDFISPGKKYNADSSIACAASLPYKLKVCGDYAKERSIDKKPMQVLIDAINNEDDLFKKLMALEHRRWNAYMLTRGYHFPDDDELKEMLKKEALQKDIKNMWHICICDSSEQGTFVSDWPSSKWGCTTDEEWDKLSELDKSSLRYYRLASERTKEIETELDQGSFLNELQYADLKKSVKQMITHEDFESVVRYESIKREVLQKDNIEDKAREDQIKVIIERNKRRDFYETDAQLIRMIPFCMWHGVDHETVLTVTNGNAFEDVIIPTLLSSKEVKYIINNGTFDQDGLKNYQETITAYFKGRGNNTTPTFICLDSNNLDQTIRAEVRKCETKEKNPAVVTCSNNDCAATIVTIAQIAKELNTPLLGYDRQKGLITYSGEVFSPALNNKHISVDEFIRLNNRRITSAGEIPFSSRQQWVLEEMMEDPSWNDNIKYLQDKKNWNPKFKEVEDGNYENSGIQSNLTFDGSVLERSRVRDFIEDLIRFKVVESKDDWSDSDGKSSRNLLFYDKGVYNKLCEYTTGRDAPDAELKMYYDKNSKTLKLREDFLGAKCIKVKDPDIERRIVKFFEQLKKCGLASCMFDEHKNLSFSFKDGKIKNLLEKEGNAFELLVYFNMKNTGLFSDVRLGIQFSRDSYTDFMEELQNSVQSKDEYGLMQLQDEIKEIAKDFDDQDMDARDIDVFAMYGMTPVFVECKATKKINDDYINRINTISNKYQGIGILCTSSKISSRIHDTNVSVLNIDLINDEKRFRQALEQILSGKRFVSK